jgi:hypothetical protein
MGRFVFVLFSALAELERIDSRGGRWSHTTVRSVLRRSDHLSMAS